MTTLKKSQLFDLDGVSLPTDQFFADDLNLDDDKEDKDDEFETVPTDPLPTHPRENEHLPTRMPRPTPIFPTEKPDTLEQMPSHSRADEMRDLSEGDDNELVVSEEPMQGTMSVILPYIPGADVSEDDEDEFADVTVEEEPDEIVIDDDPWKWTVSSFGEWLSKIMHMVPPHSGKETSGLERAISHLEAIDREISKAVRADRNGEIDISMIEKARDELYDGVVRLQERLDKIRDSKYSKRKGNGKGKKKKSDAEHEMIKSAKAAYTGDMVVTVPYIVSIVARTCLNSMISAGKDIEDTFEKLSKEFDLTRREEEETMQLLRDMGYTMRRPRGYARDEEIDYTLTDNNDWMQNVGG